MRKPAFILVVVVIGIQLFVVTLAILKCIHTNNAECAKGKAQEYFALLLSQSLALYAAENSDK